MMLMLMGVLKTGYAPTVAAQELDDLLLAMAQGDQSALEQLYRHTKKAVYGMALAVLRRHHDAEEVTQDAFVRAWEQAERYRPGGTPLAWLLAITRNLALMRLREREKSRDLEPEQWELIPANAPAVTEEDRQVLQTALDALGEQDRQIVFLFAVAGMRHREIAGMLGLNLSTALSKYHRALKKLRDTLEGDEPR